MQTTTLGNEKDAGLKFTHLAAKAAEGKVLLEDLTDISKRKAQRMIRRGREAGEDYLDETTHYVKHHPWQSVGFAAALGTFAGLILGWTWARACTRECK